jgi:hypothetical protein
MNLKTQQASNTHNTHSTTMAIRTIESVSQALTSTHADQRTYTFYKEEGMWFIDLPEYISWGGKKEDLRMKAGTDQLLKMLSSGTGQVTLIIDTEPFDGAEVMELIDLCSAPKGGGIYLVEKCNGQVVNTFIWICDIALFVFGDLPTQIYIKKVEAAFVKNFELYADLPLASQCQWKQRTISNL